MSRTKSGVALIIAFIFHLGFFGSAEVAQADPPSLYWHWAKLKLKQSECGQRAYRVSSVGVGRPTKRGDDTVWARNSRVNTTIQCIKLGRKKSLAVMIVTSNSSSKAKKTRDFLKCGMAGNPLTGRRGCGEG